MFALRRFELRAIAGGGAGGTSPTRVAGAVLGPARSARTGAELAAAATLGDPGNVLSRGSSAGAGTVSERAGATLAEFGEVLVRGGATIGNPGNVFERGGAVDRTGLIPCAGVRDGLGGARDKTRLVDASGARGMTRDSVPAASGFDWGSLGDAFGPAAIERDVAGLPGAGS